MGARVEYRILYNRVKGELENALTQLPFDGLAITQPSLLVGDGRALGQAKCSAERAAIVGELLRVLDPAN